MEQSDLLRYVTTTLEGLGLRYFITGSVRISGDQIEFAYIDDWSARRGLSEIWVKVRDAATEAAPENP
jgi:hypothetical protein